MFQHATTQQLKTIWLYEKELCTPQNYKAIAVELFKRGELDISDFRKASIDQLWVIFKNEQHVQSEELIGVFIELVKRNEIKKHVNQLLEQVFKKTSVAEKETALTNEELTILCYQYGLDAIFEYNTKDKYVFIDYFNFKLINKLKSLAYFNNKNRVKEVG